MVFMVEVNDGTCRTEVVEYLRVDLHNRAGIKVLRYVTGCDRGRVASVIPAFECDDHDRIA